jgi:hypothetical protein
VSLIVALVCEFLHERFCALCVRYAVQLARMAHTHTDASRLYSVPEDDQEIIQGMREWVGAVIADLGVCPFTVDEDRAGVCGCGGVDCG